ncbi:tripartite motif-containing protein 35-like [Neolamprologus brichardi]|uniref:tripartite motif-containing protein 35-like n=1 Tax=Neolamprologus brichardi TaxID=32507 RepID=UPI0003EC477B|nr:tripartite motif-containing protein 35-like [Neolamprologus brichardi]
MSFQSEEDLSCPICHDIFRNPIFLSCSHSFCKMCLKNWWAQKMEQQCPVCKNISEQSEPPCNLVLKNHAEAYLQERDPSASVESEVLCCLHHNKLKLFCLDHQEPACVICRDSRAHVDHKFKPIDEAAQDHKKALQKSLEPLQDKLKVLQKVQENFDITQQRIKFQDQHIEKQIKEQFKKFHQFLHEEEKVRLTALKKEEQEKSPKIKEKTAALSREMPSLLQTIGAAEEVLRAEDVSFLQNYRATLKSVQQYPSTDDPPLVSEALIDMAKHLGNLTYNIWIKMKGVVFYAPGTPYAGHPEHSVSEDLTSERHQPPDKPERFWILSTYDASKVRASGPGLTSSVSATFPAEFNIDAKDAGQGELSVLVVDQGGKHNQASIYDNGDGTYWVSYVPNRDGWYTIIIKYGGDDIPASPYRVHATSAGAASMSAMSGPDMHPTLAFGEEVYLYPISVAAPLEEHSPHLSHIVGLYGLQQDLQSPQWP